MLGSGAFVVFDDTTDFVKAAYTSCVFSRTNRAASARRAARAAAGWNASRAPGRRPRDRRATSRCCSASPRTDHRDQSLRARRLDRAVPEIGHDAVPRAVPARIVQAIGGAAGMSAPLLAAESAIVNITIDGVPVAVPKGTLLVEAAKTVKQEIPIYCYHTEARAGRALPHLSGRDRGDAEAADRLQHGGRRRDGRAHAAVREGRRRRGAMVLELFLVNHPLDCPICDKGGECDLQDYAMAYARGDVATSPIRSSPSPRPSISGRRSCSTKSAASSASAAFASTTSSPTNSSWSSKIAARTTSSRPRPDGPTTHNFTGNVTELCPVGALTSKTYRFRRGRGT